MKTRNIYLVQIPTPSDLCALGRTHLYQQRSSLKEARSLWKGSKGKRIFKLVSGR